MNTCPCVYCRRNRNNVNRSDDRLLSEANAREFLGGVSHMWLRRRGKDPRFAFPTRVELGRRRFYWLSDLAAWAESPHALMRTDHQFRVTTTAVEAQAAFPDLGQQCGGARPDRPLAPVAAPPCDIQRGRSARWSRPQVSAERVTARPEPKKGSRTGGRLLSRF
jgi:hypothetical protein